MTQNFFFKFLEGRGEKLPQKSNKAFYSIFVENTKKLILFLDFAVAKNLFQIRPKNLSKKYFFL